MKQNKTVFREARNAARQRLEEVGKDIQALVLERRSLQATVASLDELLNETEAGAPSGLDLIGTHKSPDPLQGLTESIRQLLPMLPNSGTQAAEIVRLLQTRGFNVGKYSNPVSAVKTVLTRLCAKDEPEVKIAGKTTGGRPLYAPTGRALIQADNSFLVGKGR